MNRAILIIIFYIILACCIGISSWLSYQGFLPSLKELTIPFVIVIALGLFSASSFLQLGRDSQSIFKQISALCLFLFFALFSTSSNFTSIYTTNMADEIKRVAFDEEYNKFKQTKVIIGNELSKISNKENVSIIKLASFAHENVNEEMSEFKLSLTQNKTYINIVSQVETITYNLREMRNQALDPNRPGCGPKCKVHMETIDDLVKSTDTFMPKGRTINEITKNIDNYEKKIWQSFCTSEKFMPYHLMRAMVERVPNEYKCNKLQPENFFATYGSDRLEDLRTKIALKQSYTIETLKSYVIEVSNTAIELDKMLKELIEVDPSFKILLEGKTGNQPRTIKGLSDSYSKSNTDFIPLNVSGATQRQALLKALSSPEYNTIKAIKSDGTEVPYRLSDNLVGAQVVITDEHIKIVLEPLLSKQNELISWYQEYTSLEETSNLTLVDPKNGEIGKIQETITSGFVDVPDLAQTLWAVVMGFAIDLIPILFAFVVFHGYRPEEPEYNPMRNDG